MLGLRVWLVEKRWTRNFRVKLKRWSSNDWVSGIWGILRLREDMDLEWLSTHQSPESIAFPSLQILRDCQMLQESEQVRPILLSTEHSGQSERFEKMICSRPDRQRKNFIHNQHRIDRVPYHHHLSSRSSFLTLQLCLTSSHPVLYPRLEHGPKDIHHQTLLPPKRYRSFIK